MVGCGAAHELCGVEVAQSVSREVPYRSRAPMDVLKTAVCVSGDLQAEHLLEFLVPAGGEMGDGKFALDQFDLDLETEDDVQIVGHLIRLDADEGRRNTVHGSGDLFRRKPGQLGEMAAHGGMPMLPKGEASADVIFPEARLRFVDAERGGAAQRRAVMVRGQALFVKAVASLVHDA